MKKIYVTLTRNLIVFLLSLFAQQSFGQILAWDFNGNDGTQTTVNSTTTNANLNTSTISKGSGLANPAGANAFTGSFGAVGYSTGATTLATAITAQEYLQFTISVKAGFTTSLSTLDANFLRSTNNAPNSFQWQYSLNAFASAGVNIGTTITYSLFTTGTAPNGTAQTQINLGGIAALQNVGSGTTITIRIYGWGANNSGSTFALGKLSGNDLAIGGTVTAALAAPVITTQPNTQTVCQGTSVSFTAAASGNPAPTVQWQKNAVNIPGATSATYTISSPTIADNGSYRAVFTNSQGSATSNAATLTVNSQPTATAGGSQTICQNGTATVSGATSSNGTILWTHNGVGSLSNATTLTPTYTAAAGDAGHTVILTMTVSNSPCTAATAIYSVIVNGLPTATAGGSQFICQTGTATVSGASSSNGTILWTHNGAGSLSNATTLTPTYTAIVGDIGNTVTLTMTVASSNACSPATATATYTVIVKSQPAATAGGSQTICQNGTATVSGASSANGTILWTHNGLGSISGATTLTPTYTAAAGDAGHTVTLTMTVSSSPCTAATATYSIIVNALPTATTGGSQTICQNGTATVSGATSSNGTILWTHNGAGSLSNTTTLIPTYTAAAGDAGHTVTLTMTVTSNNACTPATASATYSVSVKAQPTATAGGSQSICQNSTATVSGATSSNGTILWSHNGVGSLSNATTLTPTYTAAAGDAGQTVTLTMTVSNSPCTSATATYSVIVKANPSVAAITGLTNVCVGSTIPLTDATAGGTWSTSNSSIGSINSSGVVTGVATGNATITYTVTSNGCTGIATSVITVSAVPNPVIEFTQGQNDHTYTISACGTIVGGGQNDLDIFSGDPGGSATLQWQVSYNNGTTWVNAPGPTNTNTQYVLDPLYTTYETVAGTYLFRLIITNNGCPGISNSITLTVTGTSNLTPGSIAANQSYCGGSKVPSALTSATLPTGSTGTYTYQWQSSIDNLSFTNIAGATSTGYSPTVITQTTYYRRVAVSGGCSANSNVITVSLNTAAPATPGAITGQTTVCANTSGIIYSISPVLNASTYTWTVPTGWTIVSGQGTTSLTATATAGALSGNISVTAGNACGTSAAASLAITVNPSPTISGILGVCIGSTTQLTGSGSPAASNPWVSASPGIATISNTGLVTGIAAGSGVITYTNSNGCSITATITVNAFPTISGTLSVCIGSTTQLTGSGTPAASNPWISASTGVATVSNTGLVTGIAAGSSVITYTNNNGCSITATVTVNSLPAISGTLSVCVGSTTQLTGSGTPAASNPWVSASPAIATVSNTGLVTGVAAGTSIITYKNNNGCTATATVTVNALPTITGTLSVCIGSTTQLTGSGTPSASNPWISASPGIATVNNVGLVNGIAVGTSVITYTNNNGCTTTATVTVNSLPTITSVTATPATICSGNSSNLVVTAPGGTSTTTIVNYDFNSGANFGALNSNAVSGITSLANGSGFTTSGTSTTTGANAFTANGTAGNSLRQTASTGTNWSFTLGGASLNSYSNYKIYFQAEASAAGQTITVSYNANGTGFTSTGIAATVGANPITAGNGSYVEVLLTLPAAADNSSGLVIQLTTNNGGGTIRIDNFQVRASQSTTTFSWVGSPAATAGLPANAGTSLTTNNSINGSPAVTTTYTVTAININGCQQTGNVTVTVNPVSVPGSISGATTVCKGTNSTLLTLSGNTGTIQWQSSTDNVTFNNIVGAASSTYTATNLAVTTYYRAVVTSGVCSSSASASVAVTVSPTSVPGSISGAATVCTGTNSTLLTLSGNTGTIQWQSSTDNVTFNNIVGATPSTYTATNLAATTYYRVVVTSGVCSSSASASVAVTVSPASVAGSISGATTVCTGTNSTLLTLSGNTGTIQWQSSTDNVTFNNIVGATPSTYTATNLAATTYYRAVVTSGVCSSSASASVAVTVSPASVSGSISGAATVCTGTNSTLLTLSGYTGTIQWQSSTDNVTFNDIVGATSSTYTATDLAATTYYRAVVTSSACSSSATTSVAVTVSPAPVAGSISGAATVCSGTNSTILTLSGNTGTIQWQSSTDNITFNNIIGATSSTYTATNLIATTYYSAVVTSGACSLVNSNVAIVSIHNLWTGATSTDWNIASNWSDNQVPSISCPDVYIRGGIPNQPVLSGSPTATITNLHILSGATLTVNGAGLLQIGGAISNSGIFDAGNGAIEFNGTSPQTIASNTFLNNAINDLIITNSAGTGITLDGAQDVYHSLTYGKNGAILNTGGYLSLKSNATQTAWIGDMTNHTINGDVTVERYIATGTGSAPNHGKSWQLLAIPTFGNQSIKAAWQEGATATNIGSTPGSAGNLVPGYGTMITSAVANAATQPAPGFDIYTAAGPTMKIYDSLSTNYYGTASTQVPIYNQSGYFVFVRGDRSVYTSTAAATPTILRTKGALFTPANLPPVSHVAANTFESVGNPYASAIDMRNITLAGGVTEFFQVWDPRLGGAFNYGAFQTFSKIGNDYYVTPGGGSYGSNSVPNNYIQSGQAFFVQASGSAGTVSFTESAKANGSSLFTTPNPINQVQHILRTSLNTVNADGSTGSVVDGVLSQFDDAYGNTVDEMDARKSTNTGENLSIKTGGKLLVIERRQTITQQDTIFFNLTGERNQPYRFHFDAENLDPSVQGFLVDNYLATRTSLNMAGGTDVNLLLLVWRRDGENPLLPSLIEIAAGLAPAHTKED